MESQVLFFNNATLIDFIDGLVYVLVAHILYDFIENHLVVVGFKGLLNAGLFGIAVSIILRELQ